MAKMDMSAVIRAIVAEEVKTQLAPYADVLVDLQKLVGTDMTVRRGPGRPTAPRADKPRRAAARGDKPALVSEAAKTEVLKYQEGQQVRYKQGRGEFEAIIVGIDAEMGMLKLERTSDKKQVARPADKVYPVAG